MADIFSKVTNFVGATLKQAITPDTLRDYRHANHLFVGSNFRLVPKNGFLFHVFFDIDAVANQVHSNDPANPNKDKEIGLMVKSADLPRFSFETKTLNAYNRANIVQSKVRYEPINIVFHDDSANLIRRFWENYFTYYYRDTQSDIYVDSGITDFSIPYKYGSYTNRRYTDFGYTPKDRAPYLRSIRIYSLHQQRFSEYVLVNPIIKSFRHGQHLQGESNTLQHEMMVEYEAVLYSTGSTTESEEIKEFAQLHYDKMPSPISAAGGGPKTIFGAGGLIGTGKDILKDVQDGNLGLAAFKAARAIKNARNMNLKNAAISEISGYFGDAVNDAAGKILVPTLSGNQSLTQSTKEYVNGLDKTTSALLIAGAATTLLTSSKPKPVSGARINEVRQSTTTALGKPVNTYNKTLPANAGATTPVAQSSVISTVNDQPSVVQSSNQVELNQPKALRELNQKIDTVLQTAAVVSDERGLADQQIKNTTATISALNNKLASAQALPDSNPGKAALVQQVQNSIAAQQAIKDNFESVFAAKTQELNTLTQQLSALRTERDNAS
jgi:hypothetical protein